MMRTFGTLFTLGVSHAYFGGLTDAVGFIVPEDTARQLGRGRLLTKVQGGVLRVLFEGDAASVPRVKVAGARLRFGLVARASLANITEPPLPVAPQVAVYRNLGAPAALDAATICVLTGSALRHVPTEATRPVTVSVLDDAGATLLTDTLSATDTRDSLAFDLTGQTPGPITVAEDYGGGTGSAAYYLHPELARAGVNGVVDVAIDAAFYATPPAFQITLDARQDTLSYYLVVKNYSDADFGLLNVSDASGLAPPILFTRLDDTSFGLDQLPVTLLAPNGGRVALFQSSAKVARQQLGRKKIQLSRNGDVLIENLPLPGADRADANMILHISK